MGAYNLMAIISFLIAATPLIFSLVRKIYKLTISMARAIYGKFVDNVLNLISRKLDDRIESIVDEKLAECKTRNRQPGLKKDKEKTASSFHKLERPLSDD